jgi:hypothetical protein
LHFFPGNSTTAQQQLFTKAEKWEEGKPESARGGVLAAGASHSKPNVLLDVRIGMLRVLFLLRYTA